MIGSTAAGRAGRRRSRWLAVLSLPVLAALLCGCGAAATQSPGGGSTTGRSLATAPGSRTVSAITGSTAAVDLLAYLFPTGSAANIEAGLTYASFQRSILARGAASCMAARGLPGPPASPPAGPSSNFPALAVMRRQHALFYASDSGNRGHVSYVSPAARMSKAEAKAYNASLKVCSEQAGRTLRAIAGGSAPVAALANRYAEIYQQVAAEPSVQQAGRRAQRCAAQRGFTFQPVDGDYMVGAIIDEEGQIGQLQATKGKRAAMARDARDAGILAQCLTPLDRVRGALLSKARAALFAADALQIRQLQQDAQRTVNALLQHEKSGTH